MRILLFLCLVSNTLFSQNYKGTVLDAKNSKPIPDCLVIIKGSSISTVTDQTGVFTFPFLNKQSITLVITLLGYTTHEYPLSTYPSDTFYLSSKENLLKEIVILAEQKKILNPGNEEPILDFDFLDDKLILLSPGQKFNELRLLNEDGSSACKIKVNRKSTTLRHDCINNLQLTGPDSAWQIFYDYEKLNTMNAYTLETYEQVLGGCVCAANSNFYFNDRKYRGLKTHYYFFSEKDKGVKHDLVSFSDTAKIKKFETDYNLNYFLEVRRKSHYTLYNEPLDSIKKKMPKYREALQLDWDYTQWLGTLETEMLKNDSGIFIVNFTDTTIYKTGYSNQIKEQCHFSAFKTGRFLPKVYADPDYKDNYLIRLKDNHLDLVRFDIMTGRQLSLTTIPNVPYLPKKILIRGGNVYFIQKDLADQQQYKLVRYSLNKTF